MWAGGGMFFVDGSNLLIELMKHVGLPWIRADKPPDRALRLACNIANGSCAYLIRKHFSRRSAVVTPLRVSWYSSYQGSDADGDRIAKTLHEEHVQPVLFKRRGGREKGVDLAVAKDVLVNAFHRTMDVAVLIAGDEDYCGLVAETKRYGVQVFCVFLEEPTAPKLRLACDGFVEIEWIMRELGDSFQREVALLKAENPEPPPKVATP